MRKNPLSTLRRLVLAIIAALLVAPVTAIAADYLFRDPKLPLPSRIDHFAVQSGQ
ncbi:MAG TPA: hypothetical protein VJT49_31740 [Amycolatopsis sp.]|uniref:hypothetical protein n=1 Tax=Amycolatopsis sp. TaxID=37632 RepID=UPI002B48949E|nr:hypothetical protein [Amycolatopsis sp.]HKS49604.1 hypothetical protein [Amycolatopsis sp.]